MSNFDFYFCLLYNFCAFNIMLKITCNNKNRLNVCLCSKNVVFGSVIHGFEVVKMIEKVETVGNFHPKVPIQISGCGELIAVIKVSGCGFETME